MALLKAFLLALGLVATLLIWSARKAGRRQLPASILARGRPLVQVTSGSPGEGWQGLGAMTVADGLNLRFDHDDDPEAEASLFVPAGRTTGPDPSWATGSP